MIILKWSEKHAESLQLKQIILLQAKSTSHVKLNPSAFCPTLKYLLNWKRLRNTCDLPECMVQRSGELNQNSCTQKLIFKLFCGRSALSVLITQHTVTASEYMYYMNIVSRTAYLIQEWGQESWLRRRYSHTLGFSPANPSSSGDADRIAGKKCRSSPQFAKVLCMKLVKCMGNVHKQSKPLKMQTNAKFLKAYFKTGGIFCQLKN